MSKIQKLFNKKRPQLRRCAFCDKSGHNKSTCTDYQATLITPKNSTPSAAPIRFFVHHVHDAPLTSPHVVNLKKRSESVLEKVKTIGPQSNQSTFEHTYQAIKKIQPPTPQPIKIENDTAADTLPNFDKDTIDKLFKPASFKSSTPIKEIKIKKPNLISTKWKNLKQTITKHYQFASHNFKDWTKENFIIQKTISALAILALILVIPNQANSYFQDIKLTQNKIVSDSTNGFLSLQNSTAALMQANLPTAQIAINDALSSFGSAVETMQTKHQILQKIASVIPVLDKEVKSRQALLLSGQKIALGNTYLLKGITNSQVSASSTLEERLDIITEHLYSAIPNYQEAMKELDLVDISSLPLDYQGPFKEFKNIFGMVLSDLQNLSNLGESLKDIFGVQGQRRYLLVFQNPAELRPTGGFLGSFAILDIKDGKITNLEIPAGGTYDLQGQLDQYLIPPTPLLLTNKRWEMQDANWFPDFPASAQKILWFYRHSRNVTADGVIAINASVLERLLAITGPISDSKRGLTIAADNALPTIQQVVETGPEKMKNKPKQIISDLAPQFIEHFKNNDPKNLIPLLTSLQDALSKKEIQAYFTDNNAQEAVDQLGWSGKIIDTHPDQDYLAVFNSNIHGRKSDAKISQTVSHQAVVQADGSIIDTTIISRTHSGGDIDLYNYPNIDYIRIYVPEGSELISASGFTWPDESDFRVPDSFYKEDDFLKQNEKEIKIDERTGTRVTEEFGKTAFGNWTITTPNQTSQIQFTYLLPFKINSLATEKNLWEKLLLPKDLGHYQLVVQRQSGINSQFESQVIFPSAWKPNHSEGNNIEMAKNGAKILPTNLDSDKIFAIVMEK